MFFVPLINVFIMNNEKILLIEYCNFIDYPIGGYLSFAKQMLTAFGSQLVLVGFTEDDSQIGLWLKKNINGIEYDYFSIKKIQRTNKKPFIPERLKIYFALRKYKKKILEIGIKNIFIQTPESLFAIGTTKGLNICARIPGVENPLSISRYTYGKYLSSIFDYFFFNYLKNVNVILATADQKAINSFIFRSKGLLSANSVKMFPSRIDKNIFYPMDKKKCRLKYGISIEQKVIVTTGRLTSLKGWRLMLDSFILYKSRVKNACFYFLGDGNERTQIQNFINCNNLQNEVFITGRLTHNEIAFYLNAADIYVMGSFVEGWATSLMEAIACAKPVVITNFSSSYELVKNGENGFILENRDEKEFAICMEKCDELNDNFLKKNAIKMHDYSTQLLAKKIMEEWELI
jgi:glycosyltransferase involved in cell wall biosynthesis